MGNISKTRFKRETHWAYTYLMSQGYTSEKIAQITQADGCYNCKHWGKSLNSRPCRKCDPRVGAADNCWESIQ